MTYARVPAEILERLVVAVTMMRIEQKAYFAGDRSTERLHAAKLYEREVDRLLADMHLPPQEKLF